jgi:hypothetical protein
MIAYMAQESGKPFHVYVVSADGGSPEQPVPGHRPSADPNWSPDGGSLLFGSNPGDNPAGAPLGLEMVNLRSPRHLQDSGLRGVVVSSLVAGWTLYQRHFAIDGPAHAIRRSESEVERAGKNHCKLGTVVSQRRLPLLCWRSTGKRARRRISRWDQGSQAGTTVQPERFSTRPC